MGIDSSLLKPSANLLTFKHRKVVLQIPCVRDVYCVQYLVASLAPAAVWVSQRDAVLKVRVSLTLVSWVFGNRVLRRTYHILLK